MNNIELMKCPVCGKQAKVIGSDKDSNYIIECPGCSTIAEAWTGEQLGMTREEMLVLANNEPELLIGALAAMRERGVSKMLERNFSNTRGGKPEEN